MKYELSEKDVEIIKSALQANLNQCKDVVKLRSIPKSEKLFLKEKINHIEDLLINM